MSLAVRVIPCLDVAGGRVVKGVNFQNLRDAGDPVELAARYAEQGADELTFLDVTATVDDRSTTYDMVRSVAEIIAYLSSTGTIPPGTLISTGSPGGAGYSRNPQVFLRDGSTVTVTIEGIGSLTTHCRVV